MNLQVCPASTSMFALATCPGLPHPFSGRYFGPAGRNSMACTGCLKKHSQNLAELLKLVLQPPRLGMQVRQHREWEARADGKTVILRRLPAKLELGRHNPETSKALYPHILVQGEVPVNPKPETQFRGISPPLFRAANRGQFAPHPKTLSTRMSKPSPFITLLDSRDSLRTQNRTLAGLGWLVLGRE